MAYTPPATTAANFNLNDPVYPAVGDVDVTASAYGPTGADYAGSLAQPAVADVKLGVQYGAGGTEFTGTYVAGGGGSGMSKGRLVNAGG